MFDALINRAANSVESAVARYAVRAAIGVPFVIALGFGVAAVTITLSDRFGPAAAYGLLAAGFAAIGLVAVAARAATYHGATNLSPVEPVADAASAGSPPAEDPVSNSSSDLLLTALSTVGPRAIPAIPSLFRFLARNWALVLAVAMVVLMLAMEKSKEPQGAPEAAE